LSSPNATSPSKGFVPSDLAAERLQDLLGYVEQVVRLDEHPAFKLAEYRLANGQTYLFHQHEFHALPGVTHDLTDEDGAVWIAIERLKRADPPLPPPTLAPWLEVTPDPDRAPKLRDFLLKTVSRAERDELLVSGVVRAEDCHEAITSASPASFDIRLRLEDYPEISQESEQYLSASWLPWANQERPRRRSIGLYQKLFELVQLAELGASDQAIELVWGMGLSRWLKDGVLIDLPLLERLVEIEIDERAGGAIRIRPRQARATINLRPYEELKLNGLPIALDAARRAIALAEEDDGVSPYQRDGFEPILRGCQTRLDPEGSYLPDNEALDPTSAIPNAAPQLLVSDRWVIFARKRTENFLLKDIENLKASIEQSKDVLPGPARTLVMGPDKEADAPWTPLSNSMGGDIGGIPDPEPESPLGDLFFPKPFNQEQVEIVRRLDKTDGVVVQGPPGTGKTHTISNIICHYLATGRRVLVISHGEAALSVLRDKLPEEVRDLSISITTSEKEGLKQLEGAIRLLQSIVQSLRPGEQARLIQDIERTILVMRQRLAAIDSQIEEAARAQLSEVKGRGMRPAELAKIVLTSRATCDWFTDRPSCPLSEAGLTEEDVDRLRKARLVLGKRLEHLDAVLPSVADLPTGQVLASLHTDLIRAGEFAARVASDPSIVLRITSSEAVDTAEQAADGLDVLISATTHLKSYSWLSAFTPAQQDTQKSALQAPLETLLGDAEAVLAEHPHYIQRPVSMPDTGLESPEFAAIVAKLAAGERAFGIFAFKERGLRPDVESVRVLARAPQGADEWGHIRQYMQWRSRVGELQSRWSALAAELGLKTDSAISLRELADLAAALRALLVSVPQTIKVVDERLRQVLIGHPGPLWPDPRRMAHLRDSLRNAAAATRLSAARSEIERVIGLFPDAAGKIGPIARNFLIEAIGRADIAPDRIEATWSTVVATINELAKHRSQFDEVQALTELVTSAGAPHWAARLRAEPAIDANDPVIPAGWREAWDWATAEKFLSSIDQREQMRALAQERTELETTVAKQFVRLVRERTFYALAQSMTGPVRAALMMFATALRRIGKGTGVGAQRHRRAAQQAMAACYAGVPCWIMPSWRVAEQLPGEVGTFDLVIMDEASQSDIREVTALLRGKKVLIVGDDKQVSPTAAFIENAKIDRLERTFLTKQPFKTLLLPGSSLYDLAKVMFPDKFIMLREHFRCVEPIIRFSTQFYSEELIPLRIPTAHERLDPPLVDIHVPDGRRTGDKINHREAEVIVSEIQRIIETPALAQMAVTNKWRSIGVISLIGSKQAALINRMLLEAVGEEMILRHRIACGDSAIFQGNERDIMFLSMIADSASKQAQTATHFEQRFNVALSRARDQIYLVRSVREEELNPNDLKAKVIRHFKDPMTGRVRPSGDLEAFCDSDFEKDVLRRLVQRGYRVIPQVGAMGYRIDLVVEGRGDARLAIECDGDKYHGPERWADDMTRQRVLERVGWRFWRCWSSSFTVDPDGCMADLFATLDRLGIQPEQGDGSDERYTEHRVAAPKGSARAAEAVEANGAIAVSGSIEKASRSGIQIGDRIVVRYLDDNRTMSFVLSKDRNDPVNGIVSSSSPLGSRLVGINEEDEIEFEANGLLRRALVMRAERGEAVLS
jgi:very-short-patch-repair endonuclease/transcription elongation GreA/GreB family factor